MFKVRRGQGAIIGGAFLVLMIITSYALYTSFTRSQVAFDKTVSDMRLKDFEKGEEDIDFVYWLIDDPENLDLYILNSGSVTAHILYIIELANMNKTSLVNNDIYISPGMYLKIEDFFSNYSLNFEDDSKLQVVTERGNNYNFEYDPKIPYCSYEALTGALENMSNTLGYFVIDYHSFQWARMYDNNSVGEWYNSWEVQSDIWVVFRINMTYFGPNSTNAEINEDTHIFFITGEAANIPTYYIVSNTRTYDNVSIEKYSTIEFSYNKSQALYFASSQKGKLTQPKKFNKPTYTGIMVIYATTSEGGYSQAFPIIGITII